MCLLERFSQTAPDAGKVARYLHPFKHLTLVEKLDEAKTANAVGWPLQHMPALLRHPL